MPSTTPGLVASSPYTVKAIKAVPLTTNTGAAPAHTPEAVNTATQSPAAAGNPSTVTVPNQRPDDGVGVATHESGTAKEHGPASVAPGA
jgi:hypothetical protein